MATRWITTTRLIKMLAFLLLLFVTAMHRSSSTTTSVLAFTPGLIRFSSCRSSNNSRAICSKTNNKCNTVRWRHNTHNRDCILDGSSNGRHGSSSISRSRSKLVVLRRGRRLQQMFGLLSSSEPTVERHGGLYTILSRRVRSMIRWYRVAIVVLLLVSTAASIAVAAATSTVAPSSIRVPRTPASTVTPFTKVANAVSNMFLIAATAVAGAALGRYFILTKEAEKEREILEKDLVLPPSSSTAKTTGDAPTLSTKEQSLTLSIEPAVDIIQDDGRETLVNETQKVVESEVVANNELIPWGEVTNKAVTEKDVDEDKEEQVEEKEGDLRRKLKRSKRAAAALSLQLIEDEEVRRAKTMTAISEREKLAAEKAASIGAASRFPFSAKLRGARVEQATAAQASSQKPSLNKAADKLSAKYASMSPEQRAFSILLDLGIIQEHQDPDDPLYDTTHDDDYFL